MTNTAAEIDPLLRSFGEPGSVILRAVCRPALTSSTIESLFTTPIAPARDTQHEKV